MIICSSSYFGFCEVCMVLLVLLLVVYQNNIHERNATFKSPSHMFVTFPLELLHLGQEVKTKQGNRKHIRPWWLLLPQYRCNSKTYNNYISTTMTLKIVSLIEFYINSHLSSFLIVASSSSLASVSSPLSVSL